MKQSHPPSDVPLPLWRHLEDLRKALLWSLFGIIIAMMGSWYFREIILKILLKPLLTYFPDPNPGLTVLSVTEAFFFYMKLSFFAGLFIASPWVFFQIWRFIAPGLYAHEKRYAITFVLSTSLFFIGGGWFGYAYIVPLTLKFLLGISKNFHVMITTANYFTFFIRLIIGVGLVFEMPIFCFILAKMGILNFRIMWKFWKFAIVGSFVAAAIITPSGDMVTQSFLAVPLIVLYFLSILIVKFAERKSSREA